MDKKAVTTGVGFVGPGRVDTPARNGAKLAAPDKCFETGGPPIPGTLEPKTEKDATCNCWATPEDTGTEPCSEIETGIDASTDESPGEHDVAPTGTGIHIHTCGGPVGEEPDGAHDVSDHSTVNANCRNDREKNFEEHTDPKGKRAAASGGGDIVTDRNCISTC